MIYNLKVKEYVKPKHSRNIKKSRIGIGLEKLDRNLYNPTNCYDAIGNLGVKWVRIQSGWMRTEKQKGIYDFSWLDDIVDNLIKQGTTPWMCLCYGNPLYTESAKNYSGAIGVPPIFSEREKQAWQKYVAATVKHFQGRVKHYEVWNEADGLHCWKHGVSAKEYGEFVFETGKVIKEIDSDIMVFGGASCSQSVGYLNDMLATGCYKYMDAFTYHNYEVGCFEEGIEEYVNNCRAVLDLYKPGIKIIQGETGAQSRPDGKGAVKDANWNEANQAKFVARRMIMDIISGAYFTSYFSTVDMYENLTGSDTEITESMYGFFGVMREEMKDNKPTGVYKPKPSYKALQTVCSIFEGNYEIVNAPIGFAYQNAERIGLFYVYNDDYPYRMTDTNKTIYASFKKENNSYAFVYWKATDITKQSYSSTVTIETYGMNGNIQLINSVTGEIYDICEESIERCENGKIILKSLPFTDYPMILTFGDFIN